MGLRLKGMYIVIPESLQRWACGTTPCYHIANEKTKLIAHESLYLVGMHLDTKRTHKNFSVCLDFQ